MKLAVSRGKHGSNKLFLPFDFLHLYSGNYTFLIILTATFFNDPVYTGSDPNGIASLVNLLSHFLIRSFKILQFNKLFVSCLIPLFEISTNTFQFSRVTSYPYHFGSAPTRLHETFLGSDSNEITFEFRGDPV